MRQLYILMFLLLAASTAFGHATVAVHRPLAEKAWDKMGFTPDISSSSTAKTKLIDGAEDEDNYAWMLGTDGLLHEVTRSSLHGYNPLTGTSGDVFDHIWNHVGDYEYPSIWPPEVPHRTAKQRAMDLWQDGVRDEGAYSNMQTAFQSNDLYSDDGAGGYHYLGRVSHMLQDMTSAPHILWQNVWASHVNYENFWADQWQDWWTDFGSSETGVALRPTDNLPSRATLWQDLYTVERLTNRWNQVKVNTVNGFMDTMAWITYFRTSIWGEIVDNETEATPATTTPTSGVGAKSNTLRTMFGADYISFTTVGLVGYHYWTIDDQFGYNHYFDAEVLTDDWWPAEGDFPDGHYEAGDKDRYTGRFYFSRPGPVATGLGASSGTWPRYYPDSTEMTDSLAYYYGDCLFPLTIQYNAGLIGLAHPSVTIQASPSDKSLAVYVDSATYINSHTFRWPIKSQHGIEAPASQTGSNGKVYTFQYWSDGGARVHNINPTSDIIITAVYTTSEVVPLPASADTYVYEATPSQNYGTIIDSIGVSGQAGYRTRAYVKFDLSTIPSGSTIDSATLRLYSRRCYTGNESQISVSLKSVGGSWTETGLTWNNQPSLSTTLNVAQNFNSTGWHEWSSSSFSAIKTLVQRWFAGTETNNGFRLQLNNENYYPGDVSWWSKEYSDPSLRPQLIVNYTPPPPDVTPPTPNPTWSTEPYETSTTSISMVSTEASDSSTPVYYQFDFYDSPTSGSGGDSSGWQTSRTYTDSGLQPNHQYGYRVRARDSAPAQNKTSYSSVSYDYTDIETPSDITFGNITTTSIEAKSSNTPSGLTRGSSGLIIYNTSNSTDSGWKQNNDYWVSNSLSVNTQYGFKARARNGEADETGDSPVIYKCTLAYSPGSASFSNINTDNVQVNWTANGNPSGTEYFCENTTNGKISGWITKTGCQCVGLSPSTPYSFRVKARNKDGVETEWVNLGTVTTQHEPVIASITPTSGPFGSYLKIEGQYFYDAGLVYFEGSPSYEIFSWSDNEIFCSTPEIYTLSEIFSDDFEDGTINNSQWDVEGCIGGANACGWWSKGEIIYTDGYLKVQVVTPHPCSQSYFDTYGGQAWIKTVYNFNDGQDWVINFKWETKIDTAGQRNADYHLIEITDGRTDWPSGLYTPPQNNVLPGTQQLYLSNGVEIGPVVWSIYINHQTKTATLYEGRDRTGAIHSTNTLDDTLPWYVRFITTNATSYFYNARDDSIILYDFSASTKSEPYPVSSDACVKVWRGVYSNCKTFTLTDPNTINVDANNTGAGNGSTLYPFRTIQGAINAATTGDTVVVRPGRYYENIHFNGKNITLTSLDPNDPNIVATTIIDGNSRSSVVTFSSGEDANCKLTGFTITGAGYDWSDWYGAGIYCYQSSPEISYCNITENTEAEGGCYFEESNAVIENCLIARNSSWRGGISCYYSNISISNCDIRMNTSDGYGGGITFSYGNLWITECNITDNTSCFGGGIYCGTHDSEGSDSTFMSVYDCYISGNSAHTVEGEGGIWGGDGGGIYAHTYIAPIEVNIVNCLITGNSASTGGGIHVQSGTPNGEVNIVNCMITDNMGDGIYFSGNTSVVRNNTIAGNQGTGIFFYGTPCATVTSCIISDNCGAIELSCDYHSAPPIPTVLNLSFCDIQGGESEVYQGSDCILTWGPGNIDTDPCFADDYHLLSFSLCINAGDPNYTEDPNDYDIDGDARIIGGRIDIGADEYSPWNLLDFNRDEIVNFNDFAIFAQHWLEADCNEENAWCNSVDVDHSEVVDYDDLALLCGNWLNWHYQHDQLSHRIYKFLLDVNPCWTTLNMHRAELTFAFGIDGNNIVGTYVDAYGDHGFLYNGTTWTTLDYPGAELTYAFGIDDSNIVGFYGDDSGTHGFLYNGITWTTLDYPGAEMTSAYGIDGNNIVGDYGDDSGTHGFLYNGITWTTLDYPEAYASGIDESNIVGGYFDASGIHGFLYNGTSWTTQGQWAFGQPTGNGGTNGNPDPTSGYTGNNVFGVNLNGDYATTAGGPFYLTAGPFNCIEIHNLRLKFARWLNTDIAEYVECRIEISNDGSNWQTIWMNPSDVEITENQWQPQQYDISQIADNQSTVYIRWSYEVGNDAWPYSGWNIDDIELWGTRF